MSAWSVGGLVLVSGPAEPLEKNSPSGKWHTSSTFSRQRFKLSKALAGFRGPGGCEQEVRAGLFLSALFRAHRAKNRTQCGQKGGGLGDTVRLWSPAGTLAGGERYSLTARQKGELAAPQSSRNVPFSANGAACCLSSFLSFFNKMDT